LPQKHPPVCTGSSLDILPPIKLKMNEECFYWKGSHWEWAFF
jgi:hypothetical protein